MKIYIILEGSERMIRAVTLSLDVAVKLCDSFHHLGLYIEEKTPIDDEILIKCDHIIAMHDHYDMLINESEKEEYISNTDSITFFTFCPEYGEKLK